MKRLFWVAALFCMLALSAMAEDFTMQADFAEEGAMLLADLPEDALLIESVVFENGDYIKSYQLPDGIVVQMLRYAEFEMTLEELAQGEWMECESLEKLEMETIQGYPAQGIRLRSVQQGETDAQTLNVYIVRVDAQECVLLMQAVFPGALGEERIEEDADALIQSMQVYNTDVVEVGMNQGEGRLLSLG